GCGGGRPADPSGCPPRGGDGGRGAAGRVRGRPGRAGRAARASGRAPARPPGARGLGEPAGAAAHDHRQGGRGGPARARPRAQRGVRGAAHGRRGARGHGLGRAAGRRAGRRPRRLLRPGRPFAAGDPGRGPAAQRDRHGGAHPHALRPPDRRRARGRGREAGDRGAFLAHRSRAGTAAGGGEVTESEALSATKQALLAQRLRRGTAGPRRTIPSRPGGEQPPLSHAQERLWFLEQFTPGTTQLTIPIRLRLRGPLDAAALAAALDATVAGHDALRLRFPDTGDGRPRAVLADDATLPLTVRDAPDEAAARALAEQFLAVPFDLAAGPVARALLVRLGEDDHVLVVAVHHIAADGWSADVLLREVFARYDGRT